MTKYGKMNKTITAKTKQTEKIPGRKKAQKRNNAGGVSFKLDKWGRLQRFLILGSEAGSYYVTASKLTKQNTKNAQKCLAEDGVRFVEIVTDVLVNRRAPKVDAGLFCLVMALKTGDDAARVEAERVFNLVVKTGTHLFSVADDIALWGGWGRRTKRAFASWYTSKDEKALAYQLIKYQQRNGWSQRDVMRKAHPRSDKLNDLFGYVTQGKITAALPAQVLAFESIKGATTQREVIGAIKAHRLTWEMIPTQWMKSRAVWEALLVDMPMFAMVRNLGRLTSLGVIAPMSAGEGVVLNKLSKENVARSRIHPIALLNAMKVYGMGRGVKGSLTWNPSQNVVDALDSAIYFAFGAIHPAGKRTLLALDVSGSMGAATINGLPTLSAREGSAVMALATLKSEPQVMTIGFTGGGGYSRYSATVTELNLSKRGTVQSTINKISGLPFGGTDCALPMLWAQKNNIKFDTFVVYTDNETWAGNIHPSQALVQYRQKMVSDAKLIVVGMSSNEFTIADPDDAGMLDVVGFDTSAPNIMNAFSRGEV
jgi:60 kDa SS-A/Ro ribonucleoprotein